MLTKDTAICLRTVDYSETSQIVTLFTKRTGKIGAIAKGSKRKKSAFDGPIETLAYGQIVFKPATATAKLATLTEFQQSPVLMGLSRKLITLNAALFATELVDAFTETNDPHPNLFDAMLTFLTDLQQTSDTPNAIALLIVFQLALLNDIGEKPVLKKCVNCKTALTSKWGKFYFSSIANGLICPDCELSFPDKTPLTQQAAHCFYDLNKLADAAEPTINELENTIIAHLTQLMHRQPKLAKYFIKH